LQLIEERAWVTGRTSVANKKKNGSENQSKMDENMRIDTVKVSKEKQSREKAIPRLGLGGGLDAR